MKILFILSACPMALALSLTDCRTAIISLSAGLGLVVFAGLLNKIGNKGSKRTWYSWAAAAGGMLIVMICSAFILLNLINLYNGVKTNGSLLIPRAFAESSVVNRGFTGERALTGRWELWQNAILRYFRENPIGWFIGASKSGTMREITRYGYRHVHCHNILIQGLMESGIPGVLLILAFFGHILSCSIRLIRSHHNPMWQRMLPAIFLSICIGEMMECYTWLRACQIPIGAAFFIASGNISALGNKREFTDKGSNGGPEQTII